MPYGDGAKLQGRLVAYLPNGTVLGPLSHATSWQMTVPFNDVGSLEVSYHRNSPNWDLFFQNGLEISVQLRFWDSALGDFDFWFEPPGCRFLLVKYAWDETSRDAPYQFTLPNYAWLLRKIRQIDILKFEGDSGQRLYLSNAGKPLSDLILESQARGNVPNMGIGFDNTVDSSNTPWNVNSSIGMGFEFGQDAMSMLDALAKQRFCDWVFQGTTLNIYNPNGFMTADRTATVKLIERHDTIASPTTYSIEDVAVKLLNVGENGKNKVTTHSTRSTYWGQWEEAMTSSGVSDYTALEFLSNKELKSKYETKSEYTYDMVFGEGSPMPFIHYSPGNLITTSGSSGARVQQITLIKDGNNAALKGNVVMTNDPDTNRAVPRELRQQRYLTSLVGGAGLGGPVGTGGNGKFNAVRAMPPNPNASPEPVGVTGVTAVNGPGFDLLGRPYAQMLLSWTPVTLDTDALPLTPAAYEIQAKNAITPNDRPIQLTVSGDTAQAHVIVDDIGTYLYRVRAVSKQGVVGGYSDEASINLTWPSVTLPAASAPALTTLSNHVRLNWNGLDDTGAVPPNYVKNYCIERSTTSATAGFGGCGTLNAYGGGRDARLLDTVATAQNVWYRARFQDTTGAMGPYSSVATITGAGPVLSGLTPNSVNGNVIMNGTITALQIGDSEVTGQKLATWSIHSINQAHGYGTRNLIQDPFLSTYLNVPRYTVSNLPVNTGAHCQWEFNSSPYTGVKTTLAATATQEITARFALVYNDKWQPNLASSATDGSADLQNIDYACVLEPEYGPVRAGFRAIVVADVSPFPAGASVTVTLQLRYYDKDGKNLGIGTGAATPDVRATIASQVFTANSVADTAIAPYRYVKTPVAGVNLSAINTPAVPSGTIGSTIAYAVPFLRVFSVGMAGHAVEAYVDRPFLMQSYDAL